MCQMVFTSDQAFFDKIGEKETKKYFDECYKFICNYKNLGEKNIISAVVHLDEGAPHLHLMFVPVVHTKDKDGKEIEKICARDFWKGRDSYRKLQDAYFNHVKSKGFDLERGMFVEDTGRKHYSVEEYKKITNYENTKKILKEMKLELPEVPDINDISKFSIKRDEKILEKIIKPQNDLIKELYKDNLALNKELSKQAKVVDEAVKYQKERDKIIADNKELHNTVQELKHEYQNKNYPSGFMQLDKMNNEFVLNCYSFGDDHFAVRKMKETTIDSINLMKNKKLLYLNGNYYITDFNNLTSKEFIVYDILNNSNIMINRNEAEQIPKASYANTGISKSANNVSVMVQGYTSMRLATYNNVNDSGIGCAAIVGTNICMYWANFRGKASLAPTMMSTYTDLYKKMNIRSSTSGGTTCTEAYNGLKSYVNGKGYAIPYSGTAS